MKNHIAIKFIAIVLCALCLLGAAGGAACIIGLSEMDLYNKTVDEYRSSLERDNARNYATQVAMSYYSKILGGCPEELLEHLYAHYSDLNFDHVGYVIKDAEGQVVAGYGNLTAQRAKEVYTFPASGKYAYLVSAVPASQQQIQQLTAQQPEAVSAGALELPQQQAGAFFSSSFFLPKPNSAIF